MKKRFIKVFQKLQSGEIIMKFKVRRGCLFLLLNLFINILCIVSFESLVESFFSSFVSFFCSALRDAGRPFENCRQALS